MDAPKQKNVLHVEFFRGLDGKKPAAEYIKSVKDKDAVRAIKSKIAQTAQNGVSGEKPLKGAGAGISEFRIGQGEAHRIYFIPKSGGNGIVVLGASSKAGQDAEIKLSAARREQYKGTVKLEKEAAFRAVGKDSTLGRKILGKFSRHLPLVGTAMVASAALLSGAKPAEAARMAAEATPGIRIASAPNNAERAVRALGDSGLVVGGVGEVVTGAVEEVVRAGNDGLNLAGLGSKKIKPGIVSDITEAAVNGIKSSINNARRAFRGANPSGGNPYTELTSSPNASVTAASAPAASQVASGQEINVKTPVRKANLLKLGM